MVVSTQDILMSCQRAVDANAMSADNGQWLQLSATTPHHREVVSRGGHQAFVRPSGGYANTEASVAGSYPADACRPPSASRVVGAVRTNWTALSQHGPLPTRTSPASRRPPRMNTRQPIPLLPAGMPFMGATPRHHSSSRANR